MSKIENKIEVPFVDVEGRPIENHKGPIINQIVNTPFEWLFPGEDIIHVRISNPEDIERPVEWNNEIYTLYYGSGMKIKPDGNGKGTVIGMRRDLMQDIIKKHSDVIRFARWATPQGWYGYGIRKPKILYLPKGEMFRDLPIADGFDYVAKSFVGSLYNDRRKILLGRAKGTYSFWQRIPLSEELKAELMPYIIKKGEMLPTLYSVVQQMGMEEFQDILEICPEMAFHPTIARPCQRSFAEYLARAMASVNIGSRVKILVPSTEPVTATHRGYTARYPLDAMKSIQAHEKCTNVQEINRVKAMQVIQWSLSNPEFFQKGCAGVVDDNILGGYDIIACDENVKMGRYDEGKEMAFTIMQYFARGSAIGINQEVADRYAADFDGDQVEVGDTTALPELHDAIANLPDWQSKKIVKVSLPPTEENRIEFLKNAFSNLVGIASCQQADILAIADQDWVASKLNMAAEQMHLASTEKVHKGTDFKADCNRKIEVELILRENKKLREFVPQAKWPSWPNEWAFRRGIPQIADNAVVYYEKDSNGERSFYRRYYIDGVEVTDKNALRNIVSPEQDGTVSWIYSQMMPYALDLDLNQKYAVYPLAYFSKFVPDPPKELMDWAHEFQAWYDDQFEMVNEQDNDSISGFKTKVAEKAAKLKANRLKAAKALWSVACDKRNEMSSGGSVWFAFYDECKEILMEYMASKESGQNPVFKTVVAGIDNQVDDLRSWSGTIDVVDFKQTTKSGEVKMRKSIVCKIAGQRPAPAPYPQNHIGVVVQNAFQPDEGTYAATITRISKGAWELIIY